MPDNEMDERPTDDDRRRAQARKRQARLMDEFAQAPERDEDDDDAVPGM